MNTIAIAWAEKTGAEPTGRYLDRYRMEPEFRPAWKAGCVIWLWKGTPEDVRKARAHMKLIQKDYPVVQCFVLPLTRRTDKEWARIKAEATAHVLGEAKRAERAAWEGERS